MPNLKKLSNLIPKNKVSQKVFELYKKRAGNNVDMISKKALELFNKGYKVERAMADALVENIYNNKR